MITRLVLCTTLNYNDNNHAANSFLRNPHLQFVVRQFPFIAVWIHDSIVAFKSDGHQSKDRASPSSPRQVPTCQQLTEQGTSHSIGVHEEMTQNKAWCYEQGYHHVCYSQVQKKKVHGRSAMSTNKDLYLQFVVSLINI